MTNGVYSRERVNNVLTQSKLPPSYRIIPRRYLDAPLRIVPGDSRFCSKADGFKVLYVFPDFATAFIETIVRDRFTHRNRREVLLKEVTERAWALIASKPRTKLSLLDLRIDGCVRLGAPTDTVNARNHAAGRALSRAVYFEHEDIEGFLFLSRLTGRDVYAIFDRAIEKLNAPKTEALPGHPGLTGVLSTYSIKLIAT